MGVGAHLFLLVGVDHVSIARSVNMSDLTFFACRVVLSAVHSALS
jgi:hypothetical protein